MRLEAVRHHPSVTAPRWKPTIRVDSRVASIAAMLSVGVFSLAVYLTTLAPTVMWYDMGEFATASATLGVAHNTGYPLLVLTGKAFTFLPFGETAWRVNLVSAVFTALAVAVTFGIIRDLTSNHVGAAIGALMLAFAPTVWANATWATSYGMNLFFTAVVMRCMFDWWRTRDARSLALAALALGLGLCNHRLITLVVPPSAVLLVLGWRSLSVRSIAMSCVALAAGLSVYLYLPIRGEMEPALSWAQPPEWRTYLSMFLNGQTPSAYWSIDAADRIDILWQYPSFDLTWAGLALAGLGLGVCAVHARAIAAYLGLVVVLDAMLVQSYAIHNIYNYLTPAYLALCVLIGIAVAWVVDHVQEFASAIVRPHVAAAGVSGLIALMPALLLFNNYERVDRSGDYTAYDFARTTLDHMPANATILTDSWTAPPFWYVQLVEGYRRDVFVSPIYSAQDEDVVDFAAEQFAASRQVYVAEGLRVDVSRLRERYVVQPIVVDGIERMVTDALPKPRYRDDLVMTGTLSRVLQDAPETVVPDVPAGLERDASFAQGLTLVGVGWPAEVERGQVAQFSYYLRADRSLDADLNAVTLFFDERDVVLEQTGYPMWSQNRIIGEGVRPTSEWAQGEIHREQYYSMVPRILGPGTYDVRIAVFDASSPSAAEDANHMVSVGSIVVR